MTTSNATDNRADKSVAKEMTGLRRTALLLLMLEEESAAEVFKHFPPNQIQKISKRDDQVIGCLAC